MSALTRKDPKTTITSVGTGIGCDEGEPLGAGNGT